VAARAVEIEWQLVVRDVDAFERWLAALRFTHWSIETASAVRLSDAYFDTADWRVWGEGYALRVRRNGAGMEASLKALGHAGRGPRRCERSAGRSAPQSGMRRRPVGCGGSSRSGRAGTRSRCGTTAVPSPRSRSTARASRLAAAVRVVSNGSRSR